MTLPSCFSVSSAVDLQVQENGVNYTHCLSDGGPILLADPFPQSWSVDSESRNVSFPFKKLFECIFHLF